MPLRSPHHRPLARLVTGLAAGCLAALAACEPITNPIPPDTGPNALIRDGNNNGGNEGFYWLRPMVTPPSTFPGSFDPALAPEIRICALTADGAACDGADIAHFSTTTGAGSEIIRTEPGEEQYIVNWHTDRFDLDPAKVYRIRAYAGNYQLGLADVEVGSTMKELKNVNSDEYIALLDGKTLPIKFRIEEGAVPSSERGVIGAGENHSCALDAVGKAYCWGANWYGQIGIGSTTPSATPVAVQTALTFSEIATGLYHTCGLATDGSAHCWGYGGTGALGNGASWSNHSSPVPVAGGHTFVSITVGYYHTCGMKADGTALCWGYNTYGQLGTGSNSWFNSPQTVTGGHLFSSLSAGNWHTCGVRTSSDPGVHGTAVCWGTNGNGELGNGTIGSSFNPVPGVVAGGHDFASIDAGGVHSCALKVDGSAYCWGLNYVGTGGTGSYSPSHNLAPVPVAGGLTFRSLTSGGAHNCGIRSSSDPGLDGLAYCWGYNFHGQVGNGAAAFAGPAVPTPVAGGETYAAIDAAWYNTCGITAGGAGRCWGTDYWGQLGDGTAGGVSFTPSSITGGLTFATP